MAVLPLGSELTHRRVRGSGIDSAVVRANIAFPVPLKCNMDSRWPRDSLGTGMKAVLCMSVTTTFRPFTLPSQ